PRRTRAHAAGLRPPLRADRQALRLEVHPRRPAQAPRPARPTRAATTRRLTRQQTYEEDHLGWFRAARTSVADGPAPDCRGGGGDGRAAIAPRTRARRGADRQGR